MPILTALLSLTVAGGLYWQNRSLPAQPGLWGKGAARADLSVVPGDSGRILVRGAVGGWRLDTVGTRTFRGAAVTESCAVVVGERVRAWSRDGVSWELDTTTTNGWNHVVWIGDRFLALGDRLVEQSTDGRTWTSFLTASVDYRGAAKKGTTLILVGTTGVVSVQELGKSWSTRPRLTGATLHDVACSPTECMAVGDSGVRLRSADGVNWTRLPARQFNNDLFRQVVPGPGGDWILALASYPGLLYNFKGDAFPDEADLPSKGNLGGVWKRGSEYEAAGPGRWPLFSGDGFMWVNAGPGATGGLDEVVMGSDGWVVNGYDATMASRDSGRTWTNLWFPRRPDVVVPFAGQWIAYNASYGQVHTSRDLLTWQAATPTGGVPGMVAPIGNRLLGLVSSGAAGLKTSTNGLAWGNGVSSSTSYIFGLRGGLRRAILSFGYADSAMETVDGTRWTRIRLPLSKSRGTQDDVIAIRDSAAWLATGPRILLSRTPGRWDTVFADTSFSFQRIAADSQGILAMALRGREVHEVWSTDGISWTSRRSLLDSMPIGLGLGNGYAVAVGFKGAIRVARLGDTLADPPSSVGKRRLSSGLQLRRRGSEWRIEVPSGESIVGVHDASGRLLFTASAVEGIARIPNSSLGRGIRILRVGELSRKLALP